MSDPPDEETINLFNLFKISTKKSNKNKAVKTHKCDVCSKEFSRSDRLKAHKFVHLDSKPYSCEICFKSFAREEYLKRHSQTHYDDCNDEMYKCDVCLKEFSRRLVFRRHILNHSAADRLGIKSFSCEVCSKSFGRRHHLKRHSRTHNKDDSQLDIKPFSCEVCSKSFATRNNLESHSRTHFKDEFNDPISTPEKKQFKCDICSKEFFVKRSFRHHMVAHSGIKAFSCPVCSKAFGRKDHMKKHYRLHSKLSGLSETQDDLMPENTSHDQVGSKSFATRDNLKSHSRTHFKDEFNDSISTPEAKQFKCDICSKEFLRKKSFRCHMVTHLGIKPYSCPVCSKAFGRKDNMKAHYRLHSKLSGSGLSETQEDVMPEYTSHDQVGSKSFATRDNLKSHSRTHFKDEFNDSISTPEEKQFKCDICSKEFLRKRSFRHHMVAHSGIKAFSCPVCSKAFGRKDNMKKHYRLHSKLSGSGLSETQEDLMPENTSHDQVGSKSFATRDNLKSNSRTHFKDEFNDSISTPEEKQFKCDICSKEFLRKRSVIYHMVAHSGIKPFSCPVCSRAFGRKNHMKQHIRLHSKLSGSGLSETQDDLMPENTSHGQYKCTWKDDNGAECGKWFMHQRHLERHTHYKCDICSKNFRMKSLLRKHMVTHSGIKAFSCEVCSRTFGRKDHMNTHLRTHFQADNFLSIGDDFIIDCP